MIGLGTIANTAAVILGGVLGLLLKNGIAKRFENILMQALGLATVFIGISGVLKYMLVVEAGGISTQGTMLLIFSLVIGCLVGECAIPDTLQGGQHKIGMCAQHQATGHDVHQGHDGYERGADTRYAPHATHQHQRCKH